MKKDFKEKIKTTAKRWLLILKHLVLNPRFLLCFGLAWIITNGWSYILFGIGLFFNITWMKTVAGAYMTFLWLPFTPEKILTFGIAMLLRRLIFPEDKETEKVLRELKKNGEGDKPSDDASESAACNNEKIDGSEKKDNNNYNKNNNNYNYNNSSNNNNNNIYNEEAS